MKRSPKTFSIGGVEIKPGQRRTIDLPLPRIYTHTELTMPIEVIRGQREGPRLFVSAAIHGDEINGVEIIRRLLKLPALKRLRGTLVAVPVVNVFGFVNRIRYLPDRRDLNRSFPGSEKGSMTARLAHLFMQEVVLKCTHGIDLHTGTNNRSNLPQIRACMDDPKVASLAHQFDMPFILNANVRDGSLREAALKAGVAVLVYEGGEALRFDEVAIRGGLRGILRVMAWIGMLPQLTIKKHVLRTLVARNSLWVRAPLGGIMRAVKPLGGRVKEGETLGSISDFLDENSVKVRAPFSGVIIGRTNLPLVNEGDPIYHIARFHSSTKHSLLLDRLRTDLDPDFLATIPLKGAEDLET